MATKNGAQYIREQIDSILPQLSSEDELIIADDCSNDNTAEIIQSYADERIKLHYNTNKKGVTKNFETGLMLCSGEYIFLADQDDVWSPKKIETMVGHLQLHDLVICDCSVGDHALELKYKSFFDLNNSRKGLIRNILRNSYMGCCMAFRRNVLFRALPFPHDVPVHDMWIGLISEIYFHVHFLPQSLVQHRRHSNNASSTATRSFNSVHNKVYLRYCIIKNLILHKLYAG
jgi:glycosyltransferase involved in cell wall biosynthesis